MFNVLNISERILEETTNIILEFYKSEDNAYILPGIKDCIRPKDEEGNIISEQKRLMLCTLKELYSLFKKDHSNIDIGFSTFAKFRPKCCLLAGSSETHSVCVCSIHQNVKLLIIGIFTYKDYNYKITSLFLL